MTIQRFDSGARMSRVVVHGDTVYVAGLTAETSVGKSVGEQTSEILGRIDGYLKQSGTDKSKLLHAVIWLQDIRTVDEMNKVWDAWISPGNAPVRHECGGMEDAHVPPERESGRCVLGVDRDRNHELRDRHLTRCFQLARHA